MTDRPRKTHRIAALTRGLLRPSVRRVRSTVRPSVESLEGRALLTSVVGSVTMPYDGTLSAAIYDTQGHLVKSLLPGRDRDDGPEDQPDLGRHRPVRQARPEQPSSTSGGPPSARRAASTRAVSATRAPPPSAPTKANGGVDGVATDPSGNLYSVSWWEETHNELRKYDTDGSTLWEVPSVGGYGGIAADDQLASMSRSPRPSTAARTASTATRPSAGDPVNFSGTGTNYITVNTGRTDDGVDFDWEPLHGLAVDSDGPLRQRLPEQPGRRLRQEHRHAGRPVPGEPTARDRRAVRARRQHTRANSGSPTAATPSRSTPSRSRTAPTRSPPRATRSAT